MPRKTWNVRVQIQICGNVDVAHGKCCWIALNKQVEVIACMVTDEVYCGPLPCLGCTDLAWHAHSKHYCELISWHCLGFMCGRGFFKAKRFDWLDGWNAQEPTSCDITENKFIVLEMCLRDQNESETSAVVLKVQPCVLQLLPKKYPNITYATFK